MGLTPVKVTKVTRLPVPDKVGDITVADNHNLFVCNEISENPVLVHNCVYLEQLYDLEIEGWILIYVTRDSSFRDYVMVGAEMDKKAKKAKLEQLTRYDEHFGKVMKIKGDLQLKYFKRLVLEKPCESLAQYKKEMHGGYHWCELAKSGACFDEQKLRIVLGNLVRPKGSPRIVASL